MTALWMLVLGVSLGWAEVSQVASSPVVGTVIVEGESPVYDGEVVQARERALEDAFRKAVRKVLGAFVSAESYTQNFVSIDDSILTKSKGYIKTYRVLNERSEGDALVLQTEVTVSVEPIKDDLTALGILLESVGNPRVVIHITERGRAGDPVKHPVVAERIKELLTEKGFKVLTSPQDSAEVVISGEGTVESVSTIGATGMQGCIVRLTVKAVTGNTQDVIASESVRMNGAGVNLDAALQAAYRQAAEKAADSLVDEIAEKWAAQTLNGRTIAVEVSIDNYAKLQVLRKRLEYLFGVKHIVQRSFTDQSAVLDVTFTGSPQTLADLIQTTDFADLQIKILKFAPEKLELWVR